MRVLDAPTGQKSGFGDARITAITVLASDARFVVAHVHRRHAEHREPARAGRRQATGHPGRRRGDQAGALVAPLPVGHRSILGWRPIRATLDQSAHHRRGQHPVRARVHLVQARPEPDLRFRKRRREPLRNDRSRPPAHRPRRPVHARRHAVPRPAAARLLAGGRRALPVPPRAATNSRRSGSRAPRATRSCCRPAGPRGRPGWASPPGSGCCRSSCPATRSRSPQASTAGTATRRR